MSAAMSVDKGWLILLCTSTTGREVILHQQNTKTGYKCHDQIQYRVLQWRKVTTPSIDEIGRNTTSCYFMVHFYAD